MVWPGLRGVKQARTTSPLLAWRSLQCPPNFKHNSPSPLVTPAHCFAAVDHYRCCKLCWSNNTLLLSFCISSLFSPSFHTSLHTPQISTPPLRETTPITPTRAPTLLRSPSPHRPVRHFFVCITIRSTFSPGAPSQLVCFRAHPVLRAQASFFAIVIYHQPFTFSIYTSIFLSSKPLPHLFQPIRDPSIPVNISTTSSRSGSVLSLVEIESPVDIHSRLLESR